MAYTVPDTDTQADDQVQLQQHVQGILSGWQQSADQQAQQLQSGLTDLSDHVQGIMGGWQQNAQAAQQSLQSGLADLQDHAQRSLDNLTSGHALDLQSGTRQAPGGALDMTPPATQAPTSSDSLTDPQGTRGSTPPAATDAGLVVPDSSSRDSFIASTTPLAQQWAAKTGIPAEYFLAVNGSESNWGKAAGNELFGIKAPGNAGSTNQATWEQENGQHVDQNAGFGAYKTANDAYAAFVDLISNTPRYAPAWARFQQDHNPDALFQGLNAAGYATDPKWGSNISSIAKGITITPSDTLTNPKPSGGSMSSRQSQFGDSTLTPAEAYAACGPAAAVWAANNNGAGMTLRQATDLAKQVGWTESAGMAGIGSEQALLTKMGVKSRLDSSMDWDAVTRDASTGNPVIISTPGHYFTVDGVMNGKYHVGTSGTDLKGGSDWMSVDDMTRLMGAPSGALFVDHPGSPSPSVAVTDPKPAASAHPDATTMGQFQPATGALDLDNPNPRARPPVASGRQDRIDAANRDTARPSVTPPADGSLFDPSTDVPTPDPPQTLRTIAQGALDAVGGAKDALGRAIEDAPLPLMLSGGANLSEGQNYHSAAPGTPDAAPMPSTTHLIQAGEQQRRDWLDRNNPIQDPTIGPVTIPGVRGLSGMAADIVTDPLTYIGAGPISSAAEGIVAKLGLKATPDLIQAITKQVVEGGGWGAMQGAEDPGATPESVAKSAGQGALLGGGLGLAGAGAKAAAPAVAEFLRTPQRGEADINFALGGIPGLLEKFGLLPKEDQVGLENFAREQREAGTPQADITANLQTYLDSTPPPAAEGTRSRGPGGGTYEVIDGVKTYVRPDYADVVGTPPEDVMATLAASIEAAATKAGRKVPPEIQARIDGARTAQDLVDTARRAGVPPDVVSDMQAQADKAAGGIGTSQRPSYPEPGQMAADLGMPDQRLQPAVVRRPMPPGTTRPAPSDTAPTPWGGRYPEPGQEGITGLEIPAETAAKAAADAEAARQAERQRQFLESMRQGPDQPADSNGPGTNTVLPGTERSVDLGQKQPALTESARPPLSAEAQRLVDVTGSREAAVAHVQDAIDYYATDAAGHGMPSDAVAAKLTDYHALKAELAPTDSAPSVAPGDATAASMAQARADNIARSQAQRLEPQLPTLADDVNRVQDKVKFVQPTKMERQPDGSMRQVPDGPLKRVVTTKDAKPRALASSDTAPTPLWKPDADPVGDANIADQLRARENRAMLNAKGGPSVGPVGDAARRVTASTLDSFGKPTTVSPGAVGKHIIINNIISGPATGTKILLNSVLSPVLHFAGATAGDLSPLSLSTGRFKAPQGDRLMGRTYGMAVGYAKAGQELVASLVDIAHRRNTGSTMGEHFANPDWIGHRLPDSLQWTKPAIAVGDTLGGALHQSLQNATATIIRHMELGAAAGEQASLEKLGSPGHWGERLAHLMDHPEELPTQAVKKAIDTGKDAALQRKLGTVGASVGRTISDSPWAFILPITRIPMAAASKVVESSPLGLLDAAKDVGAFSKLGIKGAYAEPRPPTGPFRNGTAMRDAMAAFDEEHAAWQGTRTYGESTTPLELRLQHAVVGTALAAWLISKAGETSSDPTQHPFGWVTGSGPDDKDTRDKMISLGWQPDSVWDGTSYRAFRGFHGVSAALAAAGNWHDAAAYGAHGGNATAFGLDLVSRMSAFAADETFGLPQVAGLYDMLRGGPSGAQAVGRFIGSTVSNDINPALLRSIATATDAGGTRAPDTLRDKVDDPDKTMAGANVVKRVVGQTIAEGIPGLRETVPLRTNALGRVQPNAAEGLNVILPKGTVKTADPSGIVKAFTDADVKLPELPAVAWTPTDSAGVDLHPDERRQLQSAIGDRITDLALGRIPNRDGSPGRPIINGPEWATWSTETKHNVLSGLINAARKSVEAEFFAKLTPQELKTTDAGGRVDLGHGARVPVKNPKYPNETP